MSDKAQQALGMFMEGKDFHDRFVGKVDERYDAYEGVLKADDKAADWMSKLHPPYIMHIIETTLAGLVDDRFGFRVRPAPRFYDPGEYEMASQGAKAHEILHRCQLKQDHFNEFMRPFALQNMIAGLSVAKTYWKRDMVRKPYLEIVPDPTSGMPTVKEQPAREVAQYEGPSTELVDVRDFFWHEAAPSLNRARWVAHRAWLSLEEIKRMGQNGQFQNIEQLESPKDDATEDFDRDIERDLRSRTKNMIEVLEVWYQTADGIRTVTLGNRRVELVPDRPNPFWHKQYPFTVCSTQPGLFKIEGQSQVEKIRHLQLAAWDLLNQTHDNVHLANNLVVAIRSDVDDPDAFQLEPGARWMVDSPDQVQVISPDGRVAETALPHIQRLEQQMQNLAGSQPFTTTSEGQINATTATQAALVTDLASRSIQAQKNQIYLAYERIGQIRTELNQQFIRRPTMVSEIGLDNEAELVSVGPALLGKPGDYTFDLQPMAESQMRAERRSEAQGLFQMAAQYAPLAAAMSQQGAATMINLDEVWRHLLEAFDIHDPERFFQKKTPPVSAPMSPPGAAPGPEGPGGVTAPQSIDPAVSPSNQSSIAPSVFGQRAMAAQGGAVNGPAYPPAS